MNSPIQTQKDTPKDVPHFDIGLQERHKKIQERAYFKAQQRGFAPGHELEDWLEAEREVDEETKPYPSY
jgi:hypothetical protein